MEVDRFTHERARLAKGCPRIAGVDEVGRGPLAGPVVAAAAVFSPKLIRAGLAKPRAVLLLLLLSAATGAVTFLK